MADDKLKTGLEEQQVPESPGPAEPGGSPTPEQPAPEHPGPEAPQEENTPAAPSGKVIDLTEARAAGEKQRKARLSRRAPPNMGMRRSVTCSGTRKNHPGKNPWMKSRRRKTHKSAGAVPKRQRIRWSPTSRKGAGHPQGPPS